MRRSVLLFAAGMLLFGAAGAAAESYTVLTYNVGLLRVMGSDLVPLVAARAAAAPAALAGLAAARMPQVMLLEEVWRDQDAHGLLGLTSGLLLLVHAPLSVVDWSFTPFTRSTFFDSFARKGVLQATLQDGSSGARFVLVGTHTVALDTDNGVPRDRAQVAAVLSQIAMVRAALAARSQDGALPGLVLGDFNVGPGYVDEAYRAILGTGNLREAGAAVNEAPFVTWDPQNPLVHYGGYPHEPPAKIDHVFLQDAPGAAWSVQGAEVVMKDPVPGLVLKPRRDLEVPAPLSDHYAFLTQVTLSR